MLLEWAWHREDAQGTHGPQVDPLTARVNRVLLHLPPPAARELDNDKKSGWSLESVATDGNANIEKSDEVVSKSRERAA